MEFSRRNLLSVVGLFAGLDTVAMAATKPSNFNDLRNAVEKAIQQGGIVRLEAGDYAVSNIPVHGSVHIQGIAGRTRLVALDGRPLLSIAAAADVRLSGLTFHGGGHQPTDDMALVAATDAANLRIDDCEFTGTGGSGLRLAGCSGRVTNSRFTAIGKTAVFAIDSRGLEISGNRLEGISNNGIQVWTSEPREDGTIIANNRIANVAADDGGSGQNGNGINVYRAGNVTVSGNRISDCAFSAIRNNAGSNCQILNNAISRTGEVAIYCEFGFEGAVVSGNLIEDVALGISITNFDKGGRLAAVANNVIRKVKGGGTLASTAAIGIGAEADTAVSGNVVEDAAGTGIALGWGPYARNLLATGNLVRGCGRGITFSLTTGAGEVLISGNRIADSGLAAISGMDHGAIVTADLGIEGAKPPPGPRITGNLVS